MNFRNNFIYLSLFYCGLFFTYSLKAQQLADTTQTLALDSAALAVVSDEISVQTYIETYWHISVLEMKRTGIPASITLAQGIMESKYGNSKLARKANNHFGVKCRSDWRGGRAYKNDEEANECFRRYQTPIQSFVDHSTFLAANQRYAFLFLLDLLDYRSWANGLEELGYSTSGHYAEKLITIIEAHKLYVYDMAGSKSDTLQLQVVAPGSYYQKYIQRAYTKKAHSLEEAKLAGKIAMDKLHEFHRFDTETGYEYVAKDDNNQLMIEQMAEGFDADTNLSEMYDDAAKRLLPLLNKSVPESNAQTTENDPNNTTNELLLVNATTAEQAISFETKSDEQNNDQYVAQPTTTQPTLTIKYIVKQGDSLFGIAQYMGIPIEQLRHDNQLSNDNLQIGQELLVKIK